MIPTEIKSFKRRFDALTRVYFILETKELTFTVGKKLLYLCYLLVNCKFQIIIILADGTKSRFITQLEFVFYTRYVWGFICFHNNKMFFARSRPDNEFYWYALKERCSYKKFLPSISTYKSAKAN